MAFSPVILSKNEKSRPGRWRSGGSRRESSSGQTESEILHRVRKSQTLVNRSQISPILLLLFSIKK